MYSEESKREFCEIGTTDGVFMRWQSGGWGGSSKPNELSSLDPPWFTDGVHRRATRLNTPIPGVIICVQRALVKNMRIAGVRERAGLKPKLYKLSVIGVRSLQVRHDRVGHV